MKIIFLLLIYQVIFYCKAHGHRARRYIRGQNANPGDFPYIVSLQDFSRHAHFCAGSIIHPRFILTAAHCLKEKSHRDFYIVAGITNLNKRGKGNHYFVDKFLIHSNYNNNTSENDIAIIKLKKTIKISPFNSRIPIRKSEPPMWELMTTAGWGAQYFGGSSGPELNFANVTAISHQWCQKLLKRYPHQKFILTKENICTFERSKGACNGDSGGPLVYNGMQVGIISWTTFCAEGYPDVYVKLSSYNRWIKSTKRKLKQR